MIRNKRENKGLKHLNDSKAFFVYPKESYEIKILKKYNPSKKRKILIVVDDIIAHMICNKRRNPIVTQLYTTGTKLNIFLVFIHNLILLYQKILEQFLRTNFL